MKKILSILLLSICFAACSKDDNPQPNMNEAIKQVWQALNGRYVGFHEDKLSAAGSYTETIVFQPYSEPKEIKPTVILFPDFTAYGTAIITDIRFEEISGSLTCYYSIDVKYDGAIPTISFFEYGADGEVTNNEDKRNIKVIDASSFSMWNYGLTEAENAIIYAKQ